MHLPSLILTLFCCTTAIGLEITYPKANTTVNLVSTSNLTIAWTSTPSDPARIDVALVNNNGTGSPKYLCTNVTSSAHQCSIKGSMLSFDNGSGFEIVANSVGNEFLAETGPFTLYVFKATASASGSVASATSSGAATGGGAWMEEGLFGVVAAGVMALVL